MADDVVPAAKIHPPFLHPRFPFPLSHRHHTIEDRGDAGQVDGDDVREQVDLALKGINPTKLDQAGVHPEFLGHFLGFLPHGVALRVTRGANGAPDVCPAGLQVLPHFRVSQDFVPQ
jgi:hypothetical protein